jgi:hypothetical protein
MTNNTDTINYEQNVVTAIKQLAILSPFWFGRIDVTRDVSMSKQGHAVSVHLRLTDMDGSAHHPNSIKYTSLCEKKLKDVLDHDTEGITVLFYN